MQYESLFRHWMKAISRPMMETERCIRTWVELCLLFLLDHAREGRMTIPMTSAAEYIRLNLHNDTRISDLARLVNLSEGGFRSSFKKIYGMTPKKYQKKY